METLHSSTRFFPSSLAPSLLLEFRAQGRALILLVANVETSTSSNRAEYIYESTRIHTFRVRRRAAARTAQTTKQEASEFFCFQVAARLPSGDRVAADSLLLLVKKRKGLGWFVHALFSFHLSLSTVAARFLALFESNMLPLSNNIMSGYVCASRRREGNRKRKEREPERVEKGAR